MNEKNLHKTSLQPERCLLLGVALPHQSKWEIEEHLGELTSLAATAGATVLKTVLQERAKPDAACFIGRGKAQEIAAMVEEDGIDLIISDDELSPAQVKNLEEITGTKIIDRSALILDIFAAHARTRQARTQVELAQLNYYLPRLTRQWSHLSRQVGGIGTKGPGETQLETDRRLIRTRIAHLKNDLEKIDRQELTRRKKNREFVRAALVGYTNAGKSTIMNALTSAGGVVEDKLFATLDTTVRRLDLDDGLNLMISDTVGFIRKLPHHLVASFRTTLAQTVEADLLLHVVDISDPMYNEHIDIVREILRDLNISEKPSLLVMNKVDRIEDAAMIRAAGKKYPGAVFVSAKKKIRLERIRKELSAFVSQRFVEEVITIPYNNGNLLSQVNDFCQVLDREYLEDSMRLRLRVSRDNLPRFNSLSNSGK